jgi:hypothetical protein
MRRSLFPLQLLHLTPCPATHSTELLAESMHLLPSGVLILRTPVMASVSPPAATAMTMVAASPAFTMSMLQNTEVIPKLDGR